MSRVQRLASRVVVVTPYYQEPREWLQRCIDSVRSQTLACEHIVVADGHAQDWVDEAGVRHIRLDRSHGDYGNTPRAIGGLLAASEGATAIAFLDGDNWFEPDHIQACLEAAAQHEAADYVGSYRHLVRADGSRLPVESTEDIGGKHIDTNCFVLLPGAYHAIARWATMPRPMALYGDRIFLAGLTREGLKGMHTGRKTVNYLCTWQSFFHAAGETPPPYAKPSLSPEGMQRWVKGLSPREQQVASRLAAVRVA